jgi:hypothetical protein
LKRKTEREMWTEGKVNTFLFDEPDTEFLGPEVPSNVMYWQQPVRAWAEHPAGLKPNSTDKFSF